jgi:hypothetical protein
MDPVRFCSLFGKQQQQQQRIDERTHCEGFISLFQSEIIIKITPFKFIYFNNVIAFRKITETMRMALPLCSRFRKITKQKLT